MEVLAPADVTPTPFALCPRYSLLAVGMASPPAPRGDAEETGASRVDVLRLLRPSGELHLGGTLQVDCVLQAPGLRRVAWSSTLNNDDGRETVEEGTYPAGLLAGGFNDGTVRIWNPEPAILSDMKKISISKKEKPGLMLSEEPEKAEAMKANMINALSLMKSEIDSIDWTGQDFFKTSEEERGDDWEKVENDPDWKIIRKVEPAASHQVTTRIKLLTEINDMTGPVLGLAFSGVNRYWMATSAVTERIYIHDLHHPFLISKKKRKLSETHPNMSCQTTCLKWSKTFPTILASTNDSRVTRIWDVRTEKPLVTFLDKDNNTSASDLEFSVNTPSYVAVSSANNGGSPAVKIWDIRQPQNPCHQYGHGASGVLSLSWNCSGQLLASHKNGNISFYNPYKNKMIEDMNFANSDLGLTWTHSDDTVATFSTKNGVKLYEIGWMLED
uniref:Uncharacterized protein n=1 Tax=Avena sativa TaxID=4498 RepID=A0ACD5WGY7_AVESA